MFPSESNAFFGYNARRPRCFYFFSRWSGSLEARHSQRILLQKDSFIFIGSRHKKIHDPRAMRQYSIVRAGSRVQEGLESTEQTERRADCNGQGRTKSVVPAAA